MTQLAFGTVIMFFGLFLSSLVAFEEVKHSRLLGSAIAAQCIEKIPGIAETFGVLVPDGSYIIASVAAYITLMPLLSQWVGVGGAKAIYITILTLIFVNIFSVLVTVSA